MDNTKQFTAIEWCAGYGGIHLGLKRAIPNLRVIAFSEIEAFACANLVAKMENGLLEPAPVWTDLKTFPCEEFRGRVDLLVAGYPCQPFSAAGKRLGTEDPRHLWPHIAGSIRVIRPRLCFFENVEGHISLGLREVIGELEEIGYKTAWGIFSASVDAGAPHQRKRVFILAHDSSKGLEGMWERCDTQGREAPVGHSGSCGNLWPARPGEPQHDWEPPRVVGNAELRRCESRNVNGQTAKKPWTGCDQLGNAEQQGSQGQWNNTAPINRGNERLQSRSANGDNADSWQTQPSLGRDADGASDWMDYAELQVSCDNRTDELRLLGNGVVPATAERAFRILMDEMITERNKKND